MQIQNLSVPQVENEMGQKIVQRLNGLGIYGIKVGEPIVGPIISGFPLILNARTPIKKILGLGEDLALACNVESIDIKRIGGQIIAFVPNPEKTIVDFKTSLAWYLKDKDVNKMQLPILLGTSYDGKNSAIDLVEQPHILIAGSTGSGKSIFESSVIAALSVIKKPSELKFYLVDTKRLDLTLFSNLPHVEEMVRDIKGWYAAINFLYSEVQRRNILLESRGARNIKDYNEKVPKKLSHIILVIDELADLIEKDKIAREERKLREEDEDAEPKVINALKRIIQISRASGIHIIACTQRSSADVVSPVVKANFPTRIALKLPQPQDSMVILGQKGAENLLGKGDMLIQHADSDVVQRYHGAYVEIEDIKSIIKFPELIRQSIGE